MSSMRRHAAYSLRVLGCMGLTALLAAAPAPAQSTFSRGTGSTGMTGTGGNSSARTAGMQQSGQLSSDAAISRDTNGFIGAATTDFLSRSGATGMNGMSGMGGMSGMSGLGGMNRMGMGGMGLGGMGMMGMGNMGMMGMGGMGRSNFGNQSRNGFQNSGQGSGSAKALRFPLRVSPTLAIPVRTATAATLTRRFTRLPALDGSSDVTVTLEGQTAVLQGTVTSEHQRGLAAGLALLEPGIAEVRNELVVALPEPPPAPPTAPPTANP